MTTCSCLACDCQLYHNLKVERDRYRKALREIVDMDDNPGGYDGTPDYYIGLGVQADTAREALG